MDQLDDLNSKELFDLFEAARLAARYKEGSLSEREGMALREWLDASPSHRVWFEDIIGKEDGLAPQLETFKNLSADSVTAFEGVRTKIGIETAAGQPGIVRRRAIVISAAASVLLALAGFAIYKYLPGHQRNEGSAPIASVVNDVLPGQNKATLSFDGKTIVLDSAHEGLIAQASVGATIRNAGGQLSYKAATAAAEVHYNTVKTGRGGQYKLVLSDGTKVWLDAGSSLHFPTAFAGAKREIQLTGQAYFEVAHHKEPFIVHTPKADIQDLGTAFNINTYPDENQGATRVALVRGSVRLSTPGGQSQVMAPGQHAQVSVDGRLETLKGLDMDDVLAWKEGYFQYSDADLETILHGISRWYDLDIVNKTHITKRFALTVPRSVPLSVLMHGLERTNMLHYRIDGKTLTVEP